MSVLLPVQASLVTCDAVIDKWKRDRYLINKRIDYKSLVGWWKGLISQDIRCEDGLTSMCNGCTIVSRLDSSRKTIIVRCGIRTGDKYIVTATLGVLEGYSEKSSLPSVQSLLKCFQPDLLYHLTKSRFMKAKGTAAEHIAILSSLMENDMRKVGFTTRPSFRWIYECQAHLHSVNAIPRELGDWGTMTFTSTLVTGILQQLAANLHFLQLFAFTNGQANLDTLQLSMDPVSYTYNKEQINCDAGLIMNPSAWSSLTVSDSDGSMVRLYAPGTLLDQSIEYNLLPGGCVLSKGDDDSTWYNLQGNGQSYLPYIRQLGIPLFHSSYDFYSYLIALMSIPSFRSAVLDDEKLTLLFYSLFQDIQVPALLQDISKLKLPSSEEICVVLSKYHLRMDPIKYIWKDLFSKKE